MSPETDGEFLVRKWLDGGSGFLILAYGLFSIWTRSSYDVVYSIFTEHTEFFKVEGLVAIGSGILYLGTGALLVSHYFLPYSRMAHYHVAIQRLAWIVSAIGLGLFLLSFLGLHDPLSE